MDWFKKHVDTVMVLGSILTAVFWMNTKFNNIDKEIGSIKTEIALINKDIALIKAVMIMKNIMPHELAKDKEK